MQETSHEIVVRIFYSNYGQEYHSVTGVFRLGLSMKYIRFDIAKRAGSLRRQQLIFRYIDMNGHLGDNSIFVHAIIMYLFDSLPPASCSGSFHCRSQSPYRMIPGSDSSQYTQVRRKLPDILCIKQFTQIFAT